MPYSPWETLRDLPHLTLAIVRLPVGRAWWLPDVEGIVLDDRLNQAERRCALEHELQHAADGDECLHGLGPDSGRQHRQREKKVNIRAARQLIALEDLADALVWAWHSGEIAETLHVNEDMVIARIKALNDDEKAFIERRVLAKGEVA